VEKFLVPRGPGAGAWSPAANVRRIVKKYSASELMSLSPETATPVMKSCAAKSGLTL
jgi:hypothetical protein